MLRFDVIQPTLTRASSEITIYFKLGRQFSVYELNPVQYVENFRPTLDIEIRLDS